MFGNVCPPNANNQKETARERGGGSKRKTEEAKK